MGSPVLCFHGAAAAFGARICCQIHRIPSKHACTYRCVVHNASQSKPLKAPQRTVQPQVPLPYQWYRTDTHCSAIEGKTDGAEERACASDMATRGNRSPGMSPVSGSATRYGSGTYPLLPISPGAPAGGARSIPWHLPTCLDRRNCAPIYGCTTVLGAAVRLQICSRGVRSIMMAALPLQGAAGEPLPLMGA